jgi:transcriptional regulator
MLMADGDTRLWESMQNLTTKYEEPTSDYSLEDVDSSYIESLSKGVVGFTLRIDKIEGKAKLSQNHPKVRVERVIRELNDSGKSDEQAIAKWMRKKSLPTE